MSAAGVHRVNPGIMSHRVASSRLGRHGPNDSRFHVHVRATAYPPTDRFFPIGAAMSKNLTVTRKA